MFDRDELTYLTKKREEIHFAWSETGCAQEQPRREATQLQFQIKTINNSISKKNFTHTQIYIVCRHEQNIF